MRRRGWFLLGFALGALSALALHRARRSFRLAPPPPDEGGDGRTPVTAVAERDAPARPSVNRATVEALTAVHGIGPVLAQRIVDARPYASLDELVRVDGIGPVSLRRIRPGVEL